MIRPLSWQRVTLTIFFFIFFLFFFISGGTSGIPEAVSSNRERPASIFRRADFREPSSSIIKYLISSFDPSSRISSGDFFGFLIIILLGMAALRKRPATPFADRIRADSLPRRTAFARRASSDRYLETARGTFGFVSIQ